VKGEIYSLEHYTRAKLLDHSGWANLLRGTPSDVDMVLDNNGRILFVELNSNTCLWHKIPRGQQRLYEGLVASGQGKHIAVCALVCPEPGRQIDTLRDVCAFQWLAYIRGQIIPSKEWSGSHWKPFVLWWMRK
jgi:hypothetical protein